MWKALIVLLAGAVSAQTVITALEHIAADPCAAGLTTTTTDCTNGLPLTSVTYFFDPNQFDGGSLVTLFGRNFPASVDIGVSYPGGSCATALTVYGATAIPGGSATPITSTVSNTQVVLPLNSITTALTSLLKGLETAPSKLCWRTANAPLYIYSGVAVAVAPRCIAASTGAGSCSVAATHTLPTSPIQQSIVLKQTSCCIAPVTAFTSAVCYNPAIQACCGGIPYNPSVEKCCQWIDSSIPVYTTTGVIRVQSRISALTDACPCFATSDCARVQGATENACCLPSKYSELALTSTKAVGQCFNPAIQRCCNTGLRYDPGSQQCCTINGVQSVNVPCPCGVDQDCWGGQTAGAPTTGSQLVPSTPSPRLSQLVCCKQTAPPRLEAERCNIYTNYPSGTGSYTTQRCNGQCIDSTYQICCNGVVCRREFEQCCNATCCNLYVGTCGTGLRPGSTVVAPANWREYGLAYEVCTTVEQLSTVKSFWVFLLPSFLLLGTLTVFALGIVFVHKAAIRQFLVIEKLLIGFAVASIILACPLYFAPVYKYGIVTVVVGVFEILVAAAPFKKFRILGVVVAGFLLLYLFDPFHGNHYLNLASGRTQSGNPDPETAGVWYTTGKSWRNITNVASDSSNHCVQWYGGYFRYDALLQDYDRFSNPHISTFGYCGRGWVTTLLIVEGALLVATSVMFLSALLAAILPFKVAYDPIELEVRGTGSVLEYTR
eukprot:TRINITY_DN105_c0_g1_i2.p1 TRINITY_DN105_c0_g1~~TRINITY_DN105_c0_g1_i2.p1  ORF type:complete len:718 (-),score=74.61 TRINITY_DN105_c0_g1_i2:148-2301(-)